MEECECVGWCRVDHTEKQMKSRHHKDCPKRQEMVDVVKITDSPGGNAYVEKDLKTALLEMIPQDEHDDEEYIVTFTQMSVADYDDLAEFEGF
jgi:hypothetical protein